MSVDLTRVPDIIKRELDSAHEDALDNFIDRAVNIQERHGLDEETMEQLIARRCGADFEDAWINSAEERSF